MLLTGAASLCLTNAGQTFFCTFFSEGRIDFSFGLFCSTLMTEKDEIVKACQSLESRSMEFFASHGWSFILRIGQ